MTTSAERALKFALVLDDFENNEIAYLCEDTRTEVHAVLAAANMAPKSAGIRATAIPPRCMSEREQRVLTEKQRALETPEQQAQREIDMEADRAQVRREKRAKAIHDAAWWGVLLADLGRPGSELSSEGRVTRAFALAEMVSESVGRMGLVPPGITCGLEAVELEAVTPVQPPQPMVINVATEIDYAKLAELVIAELRKLDEHWAAKVNG